MSLETSHTLLNQDVICAILEHLAIPDASWYDYETATRSTKSVKDTAERRGTLARCARVCRTFLFPAMSILWRNIGSLETLHVLASRHISCKSEVSRSSWWARAVHSPTASVFQAAVPVGLPWLPTYAEYSHWVRVVHNPSASLAPPSHLSILNERSCVGPLPRLTHIRWTQVVPGTMDLLPLLSPALCSLHIVFRNLGNATRYKRQAFVEALLLQAAQTAPKLTYLRITRASGIPEAWLLPVEQFPNLEILDICEPTYDDVTTCDLLPGLAAMNSLRSLKLRLPTPLIHNAPNPTVRSFDTLQDVYLDCKHASLDDAIAFLRAVSSPHLESVRLEECECPTNSLTTSLLELCTVIHDKFRTAIRTVSLSVTPIGAPTVFEHSLDKYLEPLLHIHELTEFRLCISRTSRNLSIPVPEANLVVMAESWLRLSRLDLNYVPADELPTVQTLLSLAQRCSSLTTLNLPCIDARDVAFVPSHLPHPSLTSFGVFDGGWDSLIPEPGCLAKFLKTLFPCVVLGRSQLEAEQWFRTAESFERL